MVDFAEVYLIDTVDSFPGLLNQFGYGFLTAFYWGGCCVCQLLACLHFHQNQIFCFKCCRFVCICRISFFESLDDVAQCMFVFVLHLKSFKS